MRLNNIFLKSYMIAANVVNEPINEIINHKLKSLFSFYFSLQREKSLFVRCEMKGITKGSMKIVFSIN